MIILEKLKTVTRYELLKHLRRKRFYGALTVILVTAFLITFLYRAIDIPGKIRESLLKQMPENIPKEVGEEILNQHGIIDSPEFFAAFASSICPSIALLFSVFFSGDAIASEFERKTGVFLLVSPIRRKTLVLGKYLACLIATVSILIFSYTLTTFSLLILYRTVPPGILGSIGVAITAAAFVISLAFVFSSIMKGGMGATIATLVTYMIIFSIITTSLIYAGYDPWFVPDRASEAISTTYNVNLETVYNALGISELTIRTPSPIKSSLILTCYAILLLIVSLWLTERRELS